MDAAANDLLGLGQKVRLPRQTAAYQQGIQRIRRRPSGPVVERSRPRAVARVSPRQPAKHGLAAVVHVDRPSGQLDRSLPRQGISGQEMMKHQACRIVVSPRGTTAVNVRRRG